MAKAENSKMKAIDVLIESFLKDVDEKKSMPWQRPYQVYNAFNWLTKKSYRGFNKILLPFGEYLTANQLRQINKDRGEDFTFQKGIQWYPVTFFKKEKVEVTYDEVKKVALQIDVELSGKYGLLFRYGSWTYYMSKDDKYYKQRNILRYYYVADIKHFKNSKGETLTSRLKSGEIELTFSKPQEVIKNYIERSGVQYSDNYVGVPHYIPMYDLVEVNKHMTSEEEFFSTAFHELSHSTGASSRLNRDGIVFAGQCSEDIKAMEECIAEISAGLCCSECQVYSFVTSESKGYANNVAYVQGWKEKIRYWGKDFLYVVSQAEKAFNYIMDFDEDVVDEE